MDGLELYGQTSGINTQQRRTQLREAVVKNDVSAGRPVPIEQANAAIAQFDDEVAAETAYQPSLADKLLKNALILIQNREYHLAKNILRNILIMEANHPDALKWMGYSFKETGQLDAAIKCFRALVNVRRNEYSLFYLAEALYLQEKDDAAFDAFQDCLELIRDESPLMFDVFKCVGNIHVRSGDFEGAEECYNKAFTLKPESDALMVNYGTLEIQRENLEGAVERFRRAVQINPSNDKGWVGLALVHRQMGDMELGWANLERALDINSDNKTALRLAVEWGALDQRLDVAVRSIKGYLANNGEDLEMSFTLAKILTHLNRLAEAELEMERVLALEPKVEGGVALMQAIREHRSQHKK